MFIVVSLWIVPMGMMAQDKEEFLFLFAGVEQNDAALTDVFVRSMKQFFPNHNQIRVKHVAKGEEMQLLRWGRDAQREGVVCGIVMNGNLYNIDEVVSFHQEALSMLDKHGRELPILMLKNGEQEFDRLNERILDGFTVWVKGDNSEVDGGKLARKMIQVMGFELVNHVVSKKEIVSEAVGTQGMAVSVNLDEQDVMTASAGVKLQKVEVFNGAGAIIKTIVLDGMADKVIIDIKEFGNEENLKFRFYGVDGAVNDDIKIAY